MGMPPGGFSQARARAIEELEARIAESNANWLRRYLLQQLPRRLHISPLKVAVSVAADLPAVGVAALRHDGHLVAAAGLKADALANAKLWLAARVAEIEAAP